MTMGLNMPLRMSLSGRFAILLSCLLIVSALVLPDKATANDAVANTLQAPASEALIANVLADQGLQRLFTTVVEREQIDRERQRFLIGEEAVEEVAVAAEAKYRDPDIHFQAAVFPRTGEPLLWINNRKGTLAQWRQNRDQLVVQQLWLEGKDNHARLKILLDNQLYLVRLNQILNRYSQQVTSAAAYQPVPTEQIPSLIGSLEQQSKQAVQSGADADPARALADNAKGLRERNQQLDALNKP